ncbi:hypothetical protein [uncultured Tateyamaria sp.]|uniref:hypothetical protein n=1 Tax=uncultured Tateyamaria sp. TaxID=455651 RepID=UPI00262EA434|nr:hypothetical protein [uncultured Tateyamaria sp.]
MNTFDAFRIGAMALVTETMAYTDTHRKYGLSAEDWKLITQLEPWNVQQRQRARSILAECVQISLTIAGLPAQSLPAQYVAAMIAHLVSPSNLLVASTRAPEAFDAMAASGMVQSQEIKPVSIEQMQALVIAYAGGINGQPPAHILAKVDLQSVDQETKK